MQDTLTVGQNPLSAPVSETQFRKGTAITYLILGIVVALSALLPWEKTFFAQASGLDVGRGWVVLLGGCVAAGTAGVSLMRGYAVQGLRVAQLVCAAAAIGMFAAEYASLASACEELTSGSEWFYSSSGSENSTASCVGTFMGIGAVVALLFGSGLGVFALFRGPTTRAQ